jgi:hypothetical protein
MADEQSIPAMDPTETPSVPLAPKVEPIQFDPMDPQFGPIKGKEETETPAEPEETPAEPPEEKEEKGNVNKAMQRLQRRQAEYERAVDTKLDGIMSAIKGLAPTAPKAAGRIETLLQKLNGDKGQELEQLTPGITDVLKGVIEEIQELRAQPKTPETSGAIEEKLAELKFETFWAKYPEDYKQAAIDAQEAAEGKGLKGERLQGYMDAWLENFLASKKGAADVPQRHTTPSKSASRGIIPATGPTRPAPKLDPKQMLWAGKGGNIAGIPFRKR